MPRLSDPARFWRIILTVLLAVAASSSAVIVLDDGDPATSPITVTLAAPPPPPAVVAVDSDGDKKRDDALVLTPQAQKDLGTLQKRTTGELGEGAREKDDVGPVGQVEGPLAADELDGCRTRFVRNFSSRNGRKPSIIVWHQTVSRDRAGVADQDSLTALANSASSGVSWHALVGGVDGLCTYTVPLSMKAWTQANANPFSVGIEVQAYGDEKQYVTAKGSATLLRVTRQIAKRFGIPLRHGKVVNCQPVTSGIVEHSELGACGGGHADVTPWSTTGLIAKLAVKVTSVDRVTCRKINWWRKAGRPSGKAESNAVRRRRALDARGVSCLSSGPVR